MRVKRYTVCVVVLCSEFNTSLLISVAVIIVQISEWLSDESGPAACLEMDESHRPVKLRKVVLGFPCGNKQTEFKFDLSLNYKMASIIQTYSEQKPTLVVRDRKPVIVSVRDWRLLTETLHEQKT